MADLSLYNNKVRKDVFDTKLDDELAPELSDVYLKKARSLYTNPEEFFSATYFTDSMVQLINDISTAFKEGKGMTIPLYSFFGGGKTHSLIMLYHAFSNPAVFKSFLSKNPELRGYRVEVEEGVKVIVIGGKDSNTAPSPDTQGDVKTLWGYIGKMLGKYDIVKKDDENHTTPYTPVLEELFRGEKVLILVDEIVWYLQRLRHSVFSSYYYQCLNFFEVLAQVTNNLPVVLVVTIPGEINETGNVQAEAGYRDVVTELYERIHRVGKVYRAPIETPVDLGKVLQRRIFEQIDEKVKLEVLAKFKELTDNYSEYVDSEAVKELNETYPFHPYYVNTLRKLLEEARLQKTRDGIRLTRILVRKLWNEKPVRSLILPSDIDVSDPNIRTLLLKDYPRFNPVVDVMKNETKGLYVYFALSDYVFLSTYMYELGLNPTQFKDVLPDSKRVVTSVLDPLLLETSKLTPSDVRSRLDDISGINDPEKKVTYLITSDGRYWFTSILDPIAICRKGKDKVTDAEAEERLKYFTSQLADTPIDKIEKRGASKEKFRSQVFKPYERVVDSLDDLIDVDDEVYRTVIIWEPACRDCDDETALRKAEEKARRFIYNRMAGKNSYTPRRNANSIAVVFSLRGVYRDVLLNQTKELISCEKVNPQDYSTDDVSLKVAEGLLNSHIHSLISAIYNKVLQYYDTVAFPFENNGVSVKVNKSTEKTILGNVEETLKEERKLITELDFDSLDYYLSSTNINLKERSFSYQELRRMFYTNSNLPWVPDEALKEAVVNGVNHMDIGVMKGNNVYFKRFEGEPEYTTTILDDTVTILPPSLAAEKQINSLLQTEKEIDEGERVRKIFYVLITRDGEEIPLRELIKKSEWLDLFITGRLVRREVVEESGIDLETIPREVIGKAGEEVEVKVRVLKKGKFNGNVELECDGFEVTPKSGIPNFEATLKGKVVSDGEIRLSVKFDGKVKTVLIPVKVQKEEAPSETSLTLPIPEGVTITRVEINVNSSLKINEIMDVVNKVRIIPGVKSITGEVTLDNMESLSITVKPKGMKFDQFITTLNSASSLVGRNNLNLSGKITVNFTDPKPVQDKAVLEYLVKKDFVRVYAKR
jgi:hypothetical protein